MFCRSTDRYRQAIDFARREARLWKHSYLGCEHLLIGLIRTTNSVAATALNVDLAHARKVMAEQVHRGNTAPTRLRLLPTPRAKGVLRSFTRMEARRMHHRYIGTEHLLLALMCDGENLAIKMLAGLGWEPIACETLYWHLLRRENKPPHQSPAPPRLPSVKALFQVSYSQTQTG